MPSKSNDEQPHISDEQLLILDDLLRIRSSDQDQMPLLAYPRGKAVADYEHFTAKQLHHFVDQAAKYYHSHGFGPLVRDVAALLTFSDLDAIVSFLALSRLGYTVLLLSPRLTSQAISRLMEVTGATSLFYSDKHPLRLVVKELKIEDNVSKSCSIASRAIWDSAKSEDTTCFQRHKVNRELESQQVSVICHSSGSTGLPKPIYQQTQRLIPPLAEGDSRNDFSTFPIYHSWGKTLIVSAMYHRKCLYLPNAELPMTGGNLAAAIEHVRPGVFHAVPYVLKLMGETQRGVEALKLCSQVLYAGGACPEDLGDRLTAQGVFIGSLFGGTETGVIGVSNIRPRDDKFWDYIRLAPRVYEHLQYKPIGDGTFEFVFLNTLATLSATNSDDPPGSFHSRDIFQPHAIISHAWKYLGRLDDRITLLNGEKVLPVTMEGRVREHAAVREAVVFGIGRDIPGLLVFRSETAKDLSDQQYIDLVIPAIEDGNGKVEKFAKVGRDMVLPMPFNVHIPYADKETIIRARVYKQFGDAIDQAYQKLEDVSNGHLQLDEPRLQKYLLDSVQAGGVLIKTIDDDFHTGGMDSLHALQLRGRILNELDLGHCTRLPQNVVFETGNVRKLCTFLEACRTGDISEAGSGHSVEEMESIIGRYQSFRSHEVQGVSMPDKQTVLLTGTTGSLGVHILAKLLTNPHVQTIYCPFRGIQSLDSIKVSFVKRGLAYPDSDEKIRALPFRLDKPHLGLDDRTLELLHRDLTLIIHAAWPVNFQLALPAFEPHIRGLHNLIQLSLDVKSSRPARLLFCSSISVALGTRGQTAAIPEEPIAHLSQASGSGYSQSKLISERIVQSAVQKHGAVASNLRVGQIVGDTEHGIWNESEAPPLVIRSGLTLGVLPTLDVTCSWLPVDTLAASIIELALDVPERDLRLVYNLCNPLTFSWTRDLLPILRDADLPFVATSFQDWMDKLQQYAATVGSEEAAKACPAVKLMGYYRAAYGRAENSRKVEFDTRNAQASSASLRNAPDVINSGLVTIILDNWMSKWVVKKTKFTH